MKKINFKNSVKKDLKKISPDDVKIIFNKIKETFSREPVTTRQLKGRYAGLFRLRIGNYRIIYTSMRGGILIMRIAHRKEVYKR